MARWPDPGSPHDIACAPRLARASDEPTLTLLGAHDDEARSYFGPTDTLIVDGGLDSGVAVGQRYFVHRLAPALGGVPRALLHTAGWIRIIAAEPRAALAEVLGVCGRLERGDFLEPFA